LILTSCATSATATRARPTARAPSCGNGILDPDELCDVGYVVNGDTYEANCTTPSCGNGILDPDELCDDSNAVNGDA